MYFILLTIFELYRPQGKRKYQSLDNIKIGKERGNSYRKDEEISRWFVCTHGSFTEMFWWSQKRVNVCEYMVKTKPCEFQISITGIDARHLSWWHLSETHMAPSLPCVHIHYLSSVRERHLGSSMFQWNVHVYSVSFIWRTLHLFL